MELHSEYPEIVAELEAMRPRPRPAFAAELDAASPRASAIRRAGTPLCSIGSGSG